MVPGGTRWYQVVPGSWLPLGPAGLDAGELPTHFTAGAVVGGCAVVMAPLSQLCFAKLAVCWSSVGVDINIKPRGSNMLRL